MNKNIITKSLFLFLITSNISFADYIAIVDKNKNMYSSSSAWNIWENDGNLYDCTIPLPLNESKFYGDSFSQSYNCKQDQTRTRFDGSVTESRTISELVENEAFGTYKAQSCKDALNLDSNLNDGFFTLFLSDDSSYEFYCDMTNGGWMLISHVYDSDLTDDIPDYSNGASWGSYNNLPDSQSSFNLKNELTPDFSESKFEWLYPLYNQSFSHTANNELILERYRWVNENAPNTNIKWSFLSSITANTTGAFIEGAFGNVNDEFKGFGFLPTNHSCGAGTAQQNVNDMDMHYWGYGSMIKFGNSSTNELHNVTSGYNRSIGANTGCGTKNSILNIWIK